MFVLEICRKVMIMVVNVYLGGCDCVVVWLGILLKCLENQMYEMVGVKFLSDGDLYVLEQEMGIFYLLDYICVMYGGLFVWMLEVGDLDNVDLYYCLLCIVVKCGWVDQMIVLVLEDGEISVDEVKEILVLYVKYMVVWYEEVWVVFELYRVK